MICIFCNNPTTKVANSRPKKNRASVWRRRTCPSCHKSVTTYERIDVQSLPYIKDKNQLSPFSHGRLMISIYKELALDESAPDTADILAETIEQKLLARKLETLDISIVVQETYQTLMAFDKIAGMRYGLTYSKYLPKKEVKKAKI